jgi:hypothetical protein
MRIIVTGLEFSGTKWVTGMLLRHPQVQEVVHTSIPEFLEKHVDMKTRWPDLTGADYVVWVLRYEPFRLCSTLAADYNADRRPEFLPPNLYDHCRVLYETAGCPVVMVSYEGLVGPLGRLVFENALVQMALDPRKMPDGVFVARDGNAKYVKGG